MRKLLLVLGLGLVLTSCKKEENNSYNGISYEGDLFKVEQYNKSYFTGSTHSFKPTKEWGVIGGDVLLVDDNYMLVAIKKNHSVQLVLNKITCCSCGTMGYFKVTRVDSDFNQLSDSEQLLINCQSSTRPFTNE